MRRRWPPGPAGVAGSGKPGRRCCAFESGLLTADHLAAHRRDSLADLAA